jgi:DNA-binding transcriptional LysR family regulator
MSKVARFAEHLVAIADLGSFMKAAQTLQMTQPTLSRLVADLEEDLGFQLFVRHARGARPTPEGAAIIESARRVVNAMQGMERVARATNEVAGTLRLTTSEPIGIEALIPALPKLYSLHPKLKVEFVLNNVSSDLRRGDADLAVRLYRPVQEDLVAKHLADVPLGLYASLKYAQTHGLPKTVDEALSHTLIGFDSRGPAGAGLMALDPRLTPEVFRFCSDSLPAQMAAVQAGVGLAILQKPHAVKHPDLVEIELDLKIPQMPIWLAVHEDMRDAANIRAAMTWAAEAIQQYVSG